MKNSKNKGFTLIELLVVVAIIALLSSVALIALMSARQKSRDMKRLSDMTQMNTALELFFAANRGYPSATPQGEPSGLKPGFASSIPAAPMPADGACYGAQHKVGPDDSVPDGVDVNTYYYVPSGTPYTIGGVDLYSDYSYYFCLGNKTGDFGPGVRILTPRGVR